ncbi:hypothetical protein CCR75_000846 [Bremia lactucae]|uniref:Uncharacterized protein n=1 Tax=Bremia lactucae TaxID=4779 RepID=A0A976FNH3_BRELC|nr:hypothetical protein CCR75_000846 [Bremia lactucae]
MGGVYTRVLHVASLRPGDHVCIWDFSRWPITYQHHGIVWASGATAADMRVCHVWSPLEGFQAAQADSCFRISTLEEFMGKRKFNHLRLVEYNTSGLREILSKWGEDISRVVLGNILKLSGSRVYLRVNGYFYVHVNLDGNVKIVPEGVDPTLCGRTAFRIECYARGYNSVRVRFFHQDSGCYMFSRSTFSCFRDLRMKKPMTIRGKSGLTWEYSTLGYLRSMNQHRRYVGVRDDGVLLDVSMRGDAARIEFVAFEGTAAIYTPPDIHQIPRTYNHDKSIQVTESQSMRDYKAAELLKLSPNSLTTSPKIGLTALPPHAFHPERMDT